MGERILLAAILSVLIAFFARYYTGLGLLPGSLHGFTGPIGIIMLWIMARWVSGTGGVRVGWVEVKAPTLLEPV